MIREAKEIKKSEGKIDQETKKNTRQNEEEQNDQGRKK